MLFDTISESTVTNWDDIEPSKYEANLEGALMLVYENECNYNALMRAAGLSELKYYQETGGDLFIQEAGAFGGFLAKAKAFFQKIIEKIKALFKKFFMTINSFISSDKDFVKKYEKDILRVTDLKDFQFKGYKFGNIDNIVNGFAFDTTINGVIGDVDKVNARKMSDTIIYELKDSDEVNDMAEVKRGLLIKHNSKLTESELRDKIREDLYGDGKETLEGSDINLREQIKFISSAKDDIKAAQKLEKDSTTSINNIIKALDAKMKEFTAWDNKEYDDENLSKNKKAAQTVINQRVSMLRSLSNDITVICGTVCQALKDRNRQAKAICIKAVSYASKKNESAVYSDSDDLFAGVTIR